MKDGTHAGSSRHRYRRDCRATCQVILLERKSARYGRKKNVVAVRNLAPAAGWQLCSALAAFYRKWCDNQLETLLVRA